MYGCEDKDLESDLLSLLLTVDSECQMACPGLDMDHGELRSSEVSPQLVPHTYPGPNQPHHLPGHFWESSLPDTPAEPPRVDLLPGLYPHHYGGELGERVTEAADNLVFRYPDVADVPATFSPGYVPPVGLEFSYGPDVLAFSGSTSETYSYISEPSPQVYEFSNNVSESSFHVFPPVSHVPNSMMQSPPPQHHVTFMETPPATPTDPDPRVEVSPCQPVPGLASQHIPFTPFPVSPALKLQAPPLQLTPLQPPPPVQSPSVQPLPLLPPPRQAPPPVLSPPLQPLPLLPPPRQAPPPVQSPPVQPLPLFPPPRQAPPPVLSPPVQPLPLLQPPRQAPSPVQSPPVQPLPLLPPPRQAPPPLLSPPVQPLPLLPPPRQAPPPVQSPPAPPPNPNPQELLRPLPLLRGSPSRNRHRLEDDLIDDLSILDDVEVFADTDLSPQSTRMETTASVCSDLVQQSRDPERQSRGLERLSGDLERQSRDSERQPRDIKQQSRDIKQQSRDIKRQSGEKKHQEAEIYQGDNQYPKIFIDPQEKDTEIYMDANQHVFVEEAQMMMLPRLASPENVVEPRLGTAMELSQQTETDLEANQHAFMDEAQMLMRHPLADAENVVEPRLRAAWERSRGSGSLGPLLKEELRLKILKRREDSGQGELLMDSTPPPVSTQLTAEDEKRRDTRRAQNRGAAQRFRKRKKQRDVAMMKTFEDTVKQHGELQHQVDQLNTELARLRRLLHHHQRHCNDPQLTVADTPFLSPSPHTTTTTTNNNNNDFNNNVE